MKAWDLPIARNLLRTREDLALALDQLIEPLLGRFTRGGSGLHLGNSSALYDDRVALLEGMSRLLWGLAPYAAGLSEAGGTRAGGSVRPSGSAERAVGASDRAIEIIRGGLVAGADPSHPSYWGIGGDRDQRYVEMASIALSLLIAREAFWDPLPEESKANLASWLGAINSVELPPTNWEFFRVMVNVALRSLDRPFDPERLESSLRKIESLYRADGWYVDETNYDLYNPFAFHFYGLCYARLAGDDDRSRAQRFRERASLFAGQFLPWFEPDGRAVPFGRSLGYRFAASSFFAACAFSGEEAAPMGELKGLLLRNLRWWLGRPILDHEGVLTIGYAYPDLVAAEQYNSPGSPYWALKSFLPLALGSEHPFWKADERPLPPLPATSLNSVPGLIVCRDGGAESPAFAAEAAPAADRADHVFMLNAGQYPCWESTNAAAKYAKFAYSSRFGFCVSRSSYHLPKTGCDSSLLFSEGDGYWRERRQSRDRFACADFAYSAWNPFNDLEVRTWLFPCGPWHLRLHRVEAARPFECVEGGFSLPESTGFEGPYEPIVRSSGDGAVSAEYPWAGGGIRDIPCGERSGGGRSGGWRDAGLLAPDPNLNLLYPRVLIPILSGRIESGLGFLACAVLARPIENEGDAAAFRSAWESPPALAIDADSGIAEISCAGRVRRIDTNRVPRP